MTTNELREAAQELVDLIAAIPEHRLLACDDDPHPPSSISESARAVAAALNASSATTNEAAAQAEGRGSDLRLLLIDLDMRLRECMKLGLSAAEAYDSAYQEAVATALSTQTVQAHGEAVARIVQNSALQISMQTPDGGVFDMSRYVGATLYTHPAPAVDRGLSEADGLIPGPWNLIEGRTLLHIEQDGTGVAICSLPKSRRAEAAFIAASRTALAASAPSQAEPNGDIFPTKEPDWPFPKGEKPSQAEPPKIDEPWASGYSVRVGRDNADCLDLVFVSFMRHEFQMYPNEAKHLRDLLNHALPPTPAGSCQASESHDCAYKRGGVICRECDLETIERLSPSAPPAGRTLTDDEIDALIDKWTEGGEWFFHTSGHIMGDKPNRAEFRRLIRLAASSTTAGERE